MKKTLISLFSAAAFAASAQGADIEYVWHGAVECAGSSLLSAKADLAPFNNSTALPFTVTIDNSTKSTLLAVDSKGDTQKVEEASRAVLAFKHEATRICLKDTVLVITKQLVLPNSPADNSGDTLFDKPRSGLIAVPQP